MVHRTGRLSVLAVRASYLQAMRLQELNLRQYSRALDGHRSAFKVAKRLI